MWILGRLYTRYRDVDWVDAARASAARDDVVVYDDVVAVDVTSVDVGAAVAVLEIVVVVVEHLGSLFLLLLRRRHLRSVLLAPLGSPVLKPNLTEVKLNKITDNFIFDPQLFSRTNRQP